MSTRLPTLVLPWLLLAASAGGFAHAEPAGEGVPYRKVRLDRLGPGTGAADLLAPEGKSRWHLESVDVSTSAIRTSRTLPDEPTSVEIVETSAPGAGARSSRTVYSDPERGDAAIRWVFPDRFPELLQPGGRSVLRLARQRDGATDRLWIELAQVGVGWVHLPSGPRETVLQRARVFREVPDGATFEPETVAHRWVDPRAGVVAEVQGPADAGGRDRIDLSGGMVVSEVLAGETLMRLFVDEVDFAPRTQLSYAWHRMEVCVDGADDGLPCSQNSDCSGARSTCGTFVSTLTTDNHANMGQLVAASSWDFTPGVASCTPATVDCRDIVQSRTELNSTETCNADPNDPPGIGITCGYQGAGRVLGRQDSDPGTADWVFNNQVTEREVRPGDTTVWLRAAAQKEGAPGGFGTGETRICYDPNEGKPEVALYRFPNQDNPPTGDWYLTVGDTWSTTFQCDQVLFSGGACGESGLFGEQRAAGSGSHAACSNPGTQSTNVLKEGVVTLPSGHTLNAMLIRTVADFCVYNDCNCGTLFCPISDRVRTDTLTWQVPHVGTVALLQSAQEVPDLSSYDKVALGDIRVGHFPPVSITAGTVTDTTVDLSWDPGNDTHRIDNPDGYNVYWDTVSGASSGGSYANGATVSATSTTVSGLAPGTTYFFTVTSNSTYANPSNPGVATTYESLKYPTTISGDPSFVYPVEVQATTACGAAYTPTSEVTGLTVDKSGGGIEICWDAVHLAEACVEGYRVLGAFSPEAAANFTPLADVGPTTCWQGNPAEGYFLVVARGSGGTGPWGHFGQ